jgi:sulfur carrier protein
MNVVLNGEPKQFQDGATIAAALEALDLPGAGRGVAVAVDAEVVPRGRWEEHRLREGQHVEVVAAIQGGA